MKKWLCKMKQIICFIVIFSMLTPMSAMVSAQVPGSPILEENALKEVLDDSISEDKTTEVPVVSGAALECSFLKESKEYALLSNDRYVEYPAAQTTATASASQGGSGANLMMDGNNNTKWEAPWNGSPTDLQLTFAMEEEEYVTGMLYTSRLDNNSDGILTDYSIYASADGTNFGGEAIQTGTLEAKLGTFYMMLDTPVKAKSIRVDTKARAITEFRLLYLPSKSDDYDSILSLTTDLRENAGQHSGQDRGLWTLETLNTYDIAFHALTADGKKTDPVELEKQTMQLLNLYQELKRAQLASTDEFNGELRVAENLLNGAVAGTEPLSWRQEDMDRFRQVIENAQIVGGSAVAQTGILGDTKEELVEAMDQFKRTQIKPELSFNGTLPVASRKVENLLDVRMENRFNGAGSSDDVYIELDYKSELQFESLTFYSWFASAQGVPSVKIQYKDPSGAWVWLEDGKQFDLGWSTNTNQSEKRAITFTQPVKGTAIRIANMPNATQGAYYGIDELEVGISVDPEKVQIQILPDKLDIQEGETKQLTASILPDTIANKEVTWTSSDPSVLAVSKNGELNVVHVPEGSETVQVIITATSVYGNKTAQCTVTVRSKVAESEDKKATEIRIKNAKKLAMAAKSADYEPGAIDTFKNIITEAENKLASDVTIGNLKIIDQMLKNGTDDFEEASLIPIRETKELINRITGTNSADSFIIEKIPRDTESGMDVYEIDWDDTKQKPVIRGNNGVSLATAYNYYLKYYAYLDFPYVGEYKLQLPEKMVEVPELVKIVFPYEYRHYFNENCEYKYTASLYGEKEWRRRIDWMAMNGFNMFLLDIGEHAIWYNAKEELGLNDAAIAELRRSNRGTEQYYGKYELSQEAVDKEGALARKVAEMAFGFGMEPEIRPFVGQVPFMFPNNREDYYGSSHKAKMTIDLPGSIFDNILCYEAARWFDLPQGIFISPEVESSDKDKAGEMLEKFQSISKIYYDSLMETLGFNEYGRVPQLALKDLIGEQGFVVSHAAFPRTVLTYMNDELLNVNPDAIWMQSSWRYQTWLADYYKDNLMFLDLSADNRPKWNGSDEFGGTPWLWSMLYNFGGNTGLGGGLDHIASEPIDVFQKTQYMKGVSISPEGGDTNPILYGLMAEMTWRSEKPDVDQWIKDYTKRRYGAENYKAAKEEIDKAWDILHHTVYSAFINADGPSQTIINAHPKLEGAIARVYGTNEKIYNTEDLLPAWKALLDAEEKMPNKTAQFKFDMVDITRQILGDLSGNIYSGIAPNFVKQDKENTLKYADMMVDLCKDMDTLLATEKEFMLGTRLDRAKNRGVTDSDWLYFEKVERTFATYWIIDNPDSGGLLDYCNRHLSGLMIDYYGMRWEEFRKGLSTALDENMNKATFNSVQQPKIAEAIQDKVVAWTNDRTPYETEPKGNSLEISRALYNKYMPLIEDLIGYIDSSRDLPIKNQTAIAGNQNSESESASQVIDGDANTIWHTVYAGTERENQYVIINLGEKERIDGLRYLPRQVGSNGTITKYKIEVSADGSNYKEVANGVWEGNSKWKYASFDNMEATHVKLLSVESLGGNYSSGAEIRVLSYKEPTEPEVDKEALKALVSAAESKVTQTNQYTKESLEVLAQKIQKAKEVIQRDSASQAEVETAKINLQTAIDGLIELTPESPEPPKPPKPSPGGSEPEETVEEGKADTTITETETEKIETTISTTTKQDGTSSKRTQVIKTEKATGVITKSVTTETTDSSGNKIEEFQTIVKDKADKVTKTTTTVDFYHKKTGSIIKTQVNDGGGKETSSTAKVALSDNNIKTDEKSGEIKLAVSAEALEKAIEITNSLSGNQDVFDVDLLLPGKDMIEQMNQKKDVVVSIVVPEKVKENKTVNISKIIVEKDIIKTAKSQAKSMTILIYNEKEDLEYSWNFNGEALQQSKRSINDINLLIHVESTKELDSSKAHIKKVMDKDINNKNKNSLLLSFGKNGVLPASAKVKVKVDGEQGMKAGGKAYLYYMNEKTGKLDVVPNNQYTVDNQGYVTLYLTHCSDYILLPGKASSSSCTELLAQTKITISEKSAAKKTLLLNQKNANSAAIKLTVPVTMVIVNKWNQSQTDKAVMEGKVTYKSSNKGIAVVSKNGKITAKKVGTVTILTEIQLENGLKKTYKTIVTVK